MPNGFVFISTNGFLYLLVNVFPLHVIDQNGLSD